LSLDVVGAVLFVGIDWAAEVHAVCVLDATGRKVAAFRVEHTADGLARMVGRLARLGDPESMPVAIERPDGRLVDVLLEAGQPVVPVKPKARHRIGVALGLPPAPRVRPARMTRRVRTGLPDCRFQPDRIVLNGLFAAVITAERPFNRSQPKARVAPCTTAADHGICCEGGAFALG
jgi:hypothetical protein